MITVVISDYQINCKVDNHIYIRIPQLYFIQQIQDQGGRLKKFRAFYYSREKKQ